MPMHCTLRTDASVAPFATVVTCQETSAKVERAKAADAAFWRTGVWKGL
jgi:hypothetical protein